MTNLQEIHHQIELAQFPADVTVEVLPPTVEGDLILQLRRGESGLEFVVSHKAIENFGRGPSVEMALSTFKQALEHDLPPLGEGGTLERKVLAGGSSI